jgi:hypothetical protein
MFLLQVKKYNDTVAKEKYDAAWIDYKVRVRNGGWTHPIPIPSMYFFNLTDRDGYDIGVGRKKGWVAYADNRAVWAENLQAAIDKYMRFQ